jgi:hypothetical protein
VGEDTPVVFDQSLFGTAGHEKTSPNVAIDAAALANAREGDSCQLWIKIGGGFGHSLTVSQFQFKLMY